MSDNKFFIGNNDAFEEWISEIIEKALAKFHSEQNIPYHSPSNDTNKILNLDEAAIYCGICTRTLVARVRDGKLTSGGTGRNYRFRISDLNDFMFNEKRSK